MGMKYRLTSSSNMTAQNGITIYVHIGFEDYHAIKLKPGLAMDLTSTFISFPW